MAKENAAKFIELIRDDEALQAKLKAAAEAYDGPKDDEKAVFEATVAPLAAEAGLPVTYEEGREYADAERNLSDEELDAVAGGKSGACWVIGISTKPDAWLCEGALSGLFTVCVYAGVTMAEDPTSK